MNSKYCKFGDLIYERLPSGELRCIFGGFPFHPGMVPLFPVTKEDVEKAIQTLKDALVGIDTGPFKPGSLVVFKNLPITEIFEVVKTARTNSGLDVKPALVARPYGVVSFPLSVNDYRLATAADVNSVFEQLLCHERKRLREQQQASEQWIKTATEIANRLLANLKS